MKRLALLLLLLLPFFCMAQQGRERAYVLTKDSIGKKKELYPFRFNKHWLFHKGDSAVFAKPEINDAGWDTVKSSYRIMMQPLPSWYSEINWYRLHIYTDTSMVGKPLAFTINGSFAGQLYVDGKMEREIGVLRQGGASTCELPQNYPVIYTFMTAGVHVVALRFAGYTPAMTFGIDKSYITGFALSAGDANEVTLNLASDSENTAICIFLSSIFFALFVIHLFLFAFYRAIVSNFYFSIFCFSLAAMFFMLYLMNMSTSPAIVDCFLGWAFPLTFATAIFSFSGINNELFTRQKLRFRIITVLCVVAVVVDFINNQWGTGSFIVIGCMVLVEAVVLQLQGIYRKHRGARILGAGILLFALFTLISLAYGVINNGILFKSGSIAGLLFVVLAACAILGIPLSMSVYLSWNFANINNELKRNMEQMQLLSEQALQQAQDKKRILENQKETLEREVKIRTAEVTAQKEKIEKQHAELKVEKQKSDDLLLNILPEEVAEELKQKGHSDARYFDNVTVLFTDFVDFTSAGEKMTPVELIYELNACFVAFDEIISRWNIEKIKTIGDAYLAVCGLPKGDEAHAEKAVAAAGEILQFINERKQIAGDKAFDIRIGIHSGSVVAGIIGVKKFAYDIWGDTVNTASRIEQSSEAGKINISQTTYELVKDKFTCMYRGEVKAKNKGELSMYFVEGVK